MKRESEGLYSMTMALVALFFAAMPFRSVLGDTDSSSSRSVFFGFGKSMIRDNIVMRQRATDAVRWVGGALKKCGFRTHLLSEPVKGFEEHQNNSHSFLVSSEEIKGVLADYGHTLGGHDTIIVYSHSHGLKGRPEFSGGLVLDDGGVDPKEKRCLQWPEYAEQLLALPARTVVVLTMACYSGGLVEFLNNDEQAQRLWRTRKEQGRNFLVITSQNGAARSNPRRIHGDIVNPFTYAVLQAFEGAADGYRRGCAEKHPDGQITLREFADFVVDETRKHTAPGDKDNDPDPQITGSFDSEAVVAVLSKTKRPLGIGFGLGRETLDLALAMKGANDFVDTMARGAGLQEMRRITAQGVKVAGVSLSLEQMRETIATLKRNNIMCAYLAYNPEQNRHIPRVELDNFVDSVRQAHELARAYGAPLIVGPGMRFMTEREEDYIKAAPYADIWLIQSQRFQIDKETSRRATPEEYRKDVQRVVSLIHTGNPNAKIWVQIVVCPGARPDNEFSAGEIVALARSIEDIADAVRIYTAGAYHGIETLKEVVRGVRR